MRLDPKLEKRLQELAREKGRDLNAVLAEALGVCSTCGQVLPNARPPPKRPPPRMGEKRAQILEWRRGNPGKTQRECAIALGISAVYVNRVVRAAEDDESAERSRGE